MNCRYEKFEYSTTLLKFWLYIETSAKVMIVWKFDHLPNYLSYGPCSPNSESSHLLAPIVALYLQFCWSNVDKTRWPATFCSSVVRNCQRLIRCWWNISDQYCCWINKSKITRSFFWYEIKRLVFLIMGTERSCYWWISLLQLMICHKLWRGNAHPNTFYLIVPWFR